MRLKHILIAIIAALAVAGCGSDSSPWESPRVDQIAWSPSDWIAIATSLPSTIVVAGSDGTVKRTIEGSDSLYGWDPTGRYLLYASASSQSEPGSAIEDMAPRNLCVYDCVKNSTQSLVAQPLRYSLGFWDGDDTVGIVVPARIRHRYQARVALYDLTGNLVAQFQAPQDLIPGAAVYDRATGRLFCAVTYVHPPDFYSYFYFIVNQRFLPIPASAGYSSIFACTAASPAAAIAAVDSRGIVHRIDRLNLSQSMPTPQTWIASNRLPTRSQLGSMALSPSSTQLAIAASSYGTPYSIYVYDLATGRSMNIGAGDQPAFSHDGSQIAFIENGPYPHWDGERVYVCNVDGSNKHLIYSMPGAGGEFAGAGYGWLAAIAFICIAIVRLSRVARAARNPQPRQGQ